VIKDTYISNEYSNLYNKIKLTKYLDLYTTYNEEYIGLTELLTHYNIPYKTYSNEYDKISEFTNNMKLPLKFSYTSINNYNECHFKYYLSYILKIDDYESTFAAFIGSLYHDVLSHVFEDNFDFETYYNDYIKDKELSNKEKLLMVRIKEELKKLIEIEKSQLTLTEYKNSYYERHLSIPLNKKVDVLFHGFIDRVFYNEEDNFNYAIMDYKSGTIDTDISPMKYGLHLQLPSYLYLIERSNEFNNPKFTGIYYQNILFDRPTWSLKEKDASKVYKDNTKLVGYSTDDLDRLSNFDSTYTKSELIKSMSYTDKFNNNTKLLSDENVDKMVDYTEKVISHSIDSIIDRDFKINPKIYKKKDISCKYCKFNDICFKTNDDIEYLDTVENLDFLGGDE
jgi:ATP-dependent helicase/nuclease subunit B